MSSSNAESSLHVASGWHCVSRSIMDIRHLWTIQNLWPDSTFAPVRVCVVADGPYREFARDAWND